MTKRPLVLIGLATALVLLQQHLLLLNVPISAILLTLQSNIRCQATLVMMVCMDT